MKFLPNDLCSYNRFECQVVPPPDAAVDASPEKVWIAYAVFDSQGEKYFDAENAKLVAASRVRLVHRVVVGGQPDESESSSSDSHAVSPTFSERRERVLRERNECMHSRKNFGKKKLNRVSIKSPRIVVEKSGGCSSGSDSAASGSSSDSESSSTSSSSGSLVRRISSRPNRRVAVRGGSYPVPIVSDSEASESGRDSTVSDEDYSQDVHEMARLARDYEKRAEDWRDREDGGNGSDEASEDFGGEVRVGGGRRADCRGKTERRGKPRKLLDPTGDQKESKRRWSSVSGPGGPFIYDSQESCLLSSVVVKSLAEEIKEKFCVDPLSVPSSSSTASTTAGASVLLSAVDRLWEMGNAWTLTSVVNYFEIWKTIKTHFFTQFPNPPPNVAVELRVRFFETQFKTPVGWYLGVVVLLHFCLLLKPALAEQYLQRIAQKIPSNSVDVGVVFSIATLHATNSDLVDFKRITGQLGLFAEHPDLRPLIETLATVLMATLMGPSGNSENVSSPTVFNTVVDSLGVLLGSAFAVPGESPIEDAKNIDAKNIFDPKNVDAKYVFLSSVIDFITACIIRHRVTDQSLVQKLLRFSGFLPDPQTGHLPMPFGQYKGRAFSEILAANFRYGEWTDANWTVSTDNAAWLEFFLQHKQLCCLGSRVVKIEVERLRHRTTVDGAPERWLRHRLQVTRLCVRFYRNLVEGLSTNHKYLSYAVCAQKLFQTLLGEQDSVEVPSSPAPPAEIVKELFRPILRFGELFPEYRARVEAAVLAARAFGQRTSLETAQRELLALHGIRIGK